MVAPQQCGSIPAGAHLALERLGCLHLQHSRPESPAERAAAVRHSNTRNSVAHVQALHTAQARHSE